MTTATAKKTLDKLQAARMKAAAAIHSAAMYRVPNGNYQGLELLPCQDRPSAMQAQSLPSRRGNFLRYPDGRLTDMQGNPASQDGNFVGTLPSFGTKIEAKEAKASIDKIMAMPARNYVKTSGENCGLSVLTNDNVAQIKKAFREKPEGKSARSFANDFAKDFGVSSTTIRSIISGKTWKHVA